MRRRVTYAPYLGTLIGFLIGLLIEVKTKKVGLAIFVGIVVGGVVGVIWWNIEKLISKGTDAAFDAARNAINCKKEANDPHTPQKLSSIYGGTQTSRSSVTAPQTGYKPNPAPARTVSSQITAVPTQDGAKLHADAASTLGGEKNEPKYAEHPPASDSGVTAKAASTPVYPRQTYPIIRIASDTASGTSGNNVGSKPAEEPLRGFLKAIVIIYYVCTGLMPTVGLIAAITMFSSAALLHRFGISAGFFVFLGIFMLAVCIGVGIVCYRFAKKIVNRDVTFLRYYHTAFIVCALLELFLLILMLTVPVYGKSLASYSPSVIGEMIVSILQGAAGTIGLTVFFVRSQYVHAYMGSDDYLYESPFTRKYAHIEGTAPAQSTVQSPYRPATNAAQSAVRPAPMQPTVHSSYQSAVNAAQSDYRLEKTSNYSSSHCCICGKLLDSKYAVLFVSSDGSEARVDRTCYDALRDLGTSEDFDSVLRAKQYIFGKWISDQKKELTDYLKRYEQSAIEFLRQNRTNDQELETDRR